MSDNETQGTGQKIIGIPVEKIAKISYYLILVSSGFGLLLSFLGILGISLPGNAFFGAIGLFAVFLSLLGLFMFEERFSILDKSHFKFIALAYVTFFVVAIVLGTIFALLGSFGYLIVFLIAALQLLTFYTGFKLLNNGQAANNNNLTREYENYKSLVFSKFKKAEEKAAETVKKTKEKVKDSLDDDDDDHDKPKSIDKSA